MCRSILTYTIFLLISTLCGAQNNSSDPKTDVRAFLFQGTKKGLIDNKFPKKLAKELYYREELWVPKCPICGNVKSAFFNYVYVDKTKGSHKTNRRLLKDLRSKKDRIRKKKALRTLVDGYIQDYFVYLEMNAEQKSEMKKKLEKSRSVGMSMANSNDDFFCPSCDGACHKDVD